MSKAIYNGILLNINRRSLEIDDDKYVKERNELENKVSLTNCKTERELLMYELNIMNKQYDHHMNTKTFSKSSPARQRKEVIGDLIDDKHHSLITHGLVSNTYSNIYYVDLQDDLDIAMSVAFEIPLSVVRTKIGNICDRNGLDYNILSRSLMCQDDTYSTTCDLPFSEITREFNEVDTFIKYLCKSEMEDGTPYLDSVTSVGYSSLIKCNTLQDALVTSFNLKILLAAAEIITDGMVQFEMQRKSLGFTGGILSQYISGFIVNTIRPIEFSYTFQIGDEEVEFVLEHI